MRDPDTGWIQLHHGEFFLLWSALELGELPAVLGVPHIGRTPPARARFAEAAGAALAERDLGTVERPAPDLRRYLEALAGGNRACELHIDTADAALRAVGVPGRECVIVASAGTEIRLGPVRETRMAATMLDVVPPAGAGPGAPANVAVDVFTRACRVGEREGVEGFKEALRDGGVRGAEVGVIARAIGGRAAGGRLEARSRDGGARWRWLPETLNWVDTADGRFALRKQGEWLTVTPADHARLLGMAEDMLGSLTG
ncbi:ESX secretion-associated protein EspG [Haloechinothrix sp. LS1_15]|uniref:ESX secretion-associated protein EspG n=1 Tax=Haloechinothrix sp. LS1_15 TaxID=2652248 RepID=UPI002947CFC6|nr:ESX secretion-associated protein EspG [Haloechinothrix sp. LS1_15]MDV6012400.1 ESX secretion-associated protein EspG [Haloechinothrix sp. LS1_15]